MTIVTLLSDDRPWWRDHTIDPFEIIEISEIDDQLSGIFPQLDMNPGVESGGEQFLEFEDAGIGHGG